MKLPNEYRVNHRAASESLIRATEADDKQTVDREIDTALFFWSEAKKLVLTRRQAALAMGFRHAVDLVAAVAEAEFSEPE